LLQGLNFWSCCSAAFAPQTNLKEIIMLNTAPFAAANKAGLDALLGLSAKTLEGVEKLAALNLKVVKAGFGDVLETSRAAQSAKDPQALLALQAELMQPAAEKAAAYGRQVYDIVAATKAEVEKTAAAQTASVQNAIAGLIDAAAKNAPEGSGNGAALFKSAMAAANNAFDGLQKAGRQATEVAEANFAAVSGSVLKSTGKAKRA
jgi:phasin family protein